MNIARFTERIKAFRENQVARREALKLWLCNRFEAVPKTVLATLALMSCCLASFFLGILVERGLGVRPAFRIEEVSGPPAAATASLAERMVVDGEGEVVGSKNGTKYYYPYCSGVSRINPENLIRFASAGAAEKKGYTLSQTCKAP